jgi:CRISPR system Cascade subunit CasC
MAQSVQAMATYLDGIERMYGDHGESRHVSSLHPWPRDKEPVVPLQQAIDQSLDDVFGDQS